MNENDIFLRANSAALRLLSHRPRSATEVRLRLKRRFPDPVIDQVIRHLSDQSLVDDGKFARLWKESRDSSSPRSATAIRRELLLKGVDREIAESAVDQMDDDDGAYRAGLKLTRRLPKNDFQTFRKKLWGYLQRRGFSRSVARRTVQRLWEESHE